MASFPSASAFSLPVPSPRLPRTLSAAQTAPKKRKKHSHDWGDDEEDAESNTSDAASEEILPGPSLVLSPDEAHQYRVAGLSFDNELPGGLFPHAPAKEYPYKKQARRDVLKGLSSLSSPIYPPVSAALQGNLRFQHIGVLTTILHRSLLQRDYIRAGRAWGLILREEFKGRSVDVRTESRWGIGAEILLRQSRQRSDIASGIRTEPGEPQDAENIPRLCFTKKGFEDAKEYYERLIIQHPYRKAAPDAICSLHFYPAMFGLWIYVIQEESKVARAHIQGGNGDSSEEEFSDDEAEFGQGASKQRKQSLIAEARTTELEQAQQIAMKMDEVIISPPYSDSLELLELRGMVSLWIADLFVLCVPQDETDDFDNIEGEHVRELSSSIQKRRDRRIASEKRKPEVEKAREFFERAMRRNKGVTHTLEDFHLDDMGSPIDLD